MNLGLIETTCHQIEDLLAPVRDGREALDADLFTLLFATADAIEEAGMRLREQQDLTGSLLAALLPRLEAAVVERESRLPQTAPDRSRVSDTPPDESAAAICAPEFPARPPAMTLPPVTSPPAPARVVEPPPTSSGSGGGGFVRVPAEKLDTLLSRSGELLVARRRMMERTEELTGIRDVFERWKSEWRDIERPLRKLLQQDQEGRVSRLLSAASKRLFSRSTAAALGQVGERLHRVEKDLERFATILADDGRHLDQVADLLDSEVRRLRMLPFASACQGLDRQVRDLAQDSGKEIELILEGGDVELDRSVLERLKDPLLHLVRNAVDHGIESPSQRRAAGKPPAGRITVAATLRGSQVEVSVADDGRGIDLEPLREQARKKRLPEALDDRKLVYQIFQPGVTTAPIITSVSGRGVGLDVVKTRVESIHGTIDLSFTPGQGSRFTLAVPLTLTTLRALLVEAGGLTWAWASTNIHRLVHVGPEDFRTVGGREVLRTDEGPIPVAALATTLGLPAGAHSRPDGGRPGLIVAAGERRMAFVVDDLLAEQEIVVKGLGVRLRRVRHFSGATVLPSGRVALVLNAANLIRTAMNQAAGPTLSAASASPAPPARKRLLVVDDSLTTRTLEKSILEAAGYEILTAADGAAGWRLLQEQPVDLVISDVEMPDMDGLTLTETIRRSKRFADLPVILVTARSSDQDKARGIEVGADAYIVKSDFEQKSLLETVAQLL